MRVHYDTQCNHVPVTVLVSFWEVPSSQQDGQHLRDR